MHGKVEITLGGEKHKLFFNNYAKAELSNQYDTDLRQAAIKIGQDIMNNYMRALSKVVYAGMVGFYAAMDEDNPFTRAQVAEWVGDASDEDLLNVYNCWRDSDYIRQILPQQSSDQEATSQPDSKKKKRLKQS